MPEDFALDPLLVQEFLEESEELLEGVDEDLVALEAARGNAELVNRLFRAVHTIKGTAGAFGFEPIVRICHAAEDVLNAARRNQSELNPPAAEAILQARDQLSLMLNDLRQGGLKQYSVEPLIRALQAAAGEISNHGGAGSNPAACGLSGEVPAAHTHGTDCDPEGQRLSAARASRVPTMRVDVRKLDELINLIGELVLERNRVVQLSRDLGAGLIVADELEPLLAGSASRLSFITEELQGAGLKTRMVPIESVLRRFPRMVRDACRALGKEVLLIVSGEQTEVDKAMVELIADPLVHLIRNAVDHGIEQPEARVRSGKKIQGTIRLDARQEGDQIVIHLSDDGAGIDREKVGRKALEKGLATSERLARLSAREVMEFIFLPGFSTAERTTELSGRGVGLDVVRSNLKRLNGSIEMDSVPGKGTSIVLRLPLTLAILPVLIVESRQEAYALPLRAVVETVQVEPHCLHCVEGEELICLRGETLPALRLSELFPARELSRHGSGNVSPRKAVIMTVADRRVALLVDRLLGQESTVVKPLGSYLSQCTGLGGATIGSDGRVRLVLDPAGLLSLTSGGNLRKATA